MNTIDPHEVERLRVEIDAVRAQMSASELATRLAERDREYQRRIKSLENAVAGMTQQGADVHTDLIRLLELVNTVVAQIHIQGYAIVPGLLDAEQVEHVRDGMEPLFAASRRMFVKNDPRGAPQTIHIHNVLAKSRAADEVAVNPLLRAIVGGVLGHDFVFNAGAIAMSPDPGCAPQELHRDDGSYALIPRPRLPLILTAAVALDDFTKDNGATRLVPGSCCWPGSRRPDESEVIQCEMSAGSVLFWDGSVFHGGGGNTTKDSSRRTLGLNYARGWLRTQFNQYLSIPRAVVSTLRSELQGDLGYRPSARGLGTCDNQDPLVYLQRIVQLGGDGVQARLGPEVEIAADATR